MTFEAAAEVCTSMAQEIRDLRMTGENPSAALNAMVESLCSAPASTTIDALALAAVSRKLLAAVVGDTQQDVSGAIEAREITACALVFLHRAIAVLEAQTGFSAEGFTGEADAIN